MRSVSMLISVALVALLASVSVATAAPADLDPLFDGDGIYTNGTTLSDVGVLDTVVQPDGKIVTVTAKGAPSDIRVNRYNSDGSPDASFGTNGLETIDIAGDFDYGRDILIKSDGKILIAGNSKEAGESRFLLLQLESDGDLDPSFGGGDGFVVTEVGYSDAYGLAVTIATDGKIVVAGQGDGDQYDLIPLGADNDFALARYSATGAIDTTFGFDDPADPDPGTLRLGWTTQGLEAGGLNEKAVGVWPQADGKILAAGQTQVGLDMFFAVARFDSTGFVDATFATGGHTTAPAISTYADIPTEAVMQADGKIVVVGETLWANGRTDKDFAVARFNTDGSMDTTFAGDGTVDIDFFSFHDDLANGVAIDECGRLVVVGQAENAADTDFDMAAMRLQPDGSLDSTFALSGRYVDPFGTYNDFFHSVAWQPADGKLVLSGLTVNDSMLNHHTKVLQRLLGGGACVQAVPEAVAEITAPRRGRTLKRRLMLKVRGRIRASNAKVANVVKVEVALVRESRTKCHQATSKRGRFSRFTRPRRWPCLPTKWIAASGTRRWSASFDRNLPRGRYRLFSRVTLKNGTTHANFWSRRSAVAFSLR